LKADDFRSRIVRFSNSHLFEVLSACIIITHSLFIGAYVEYLAVVSMKGHIVFTIGNAVLTACFVGEVAIKVIAEGKHFFTVQERWWNFFDTTLIALVFVDIIIKFTLSGNAKKNATTFLKVGEMARTARVLRIFHFLHFSKTLSVIIHQIFISIIPLMWILLLCLMLIFAISVCLTTGSLYLLNTVADDAEAIVMTDELKNLEKYFGSVHATIYTTFAAMSGGYQWADIVELMEQMGWVYQAMFIGFMAMFTLCMLNIITGIFVDNALKADDELLSEQAFQKEQEHCASLTLLFEQKQLPDGQVTCKDFVEMANHPELVWFFRELRIPQSEAAAVFFLLDPSSDGAMDIHDCVHCLLRLKGQSSALDMRTLMHDVSDMSHLMRDYAKFGKQTLNAVGTLVAQNNAFCAQNNAVLLNKDASASCPAPAASTPASGRLTAVTPLPHLATMKSSEFESVESSNGAQNPLKTLKMKPRTKKKAGRVTVMEDALVPPPQGPGAGSQEME